MSQGTVPVNYGNYNINIIETRSNVTQCSLQNHSKTSSWIKTRSNCKLGMIVYRTVLVQYRKLRLAYKFEYHKVLYYQYYSVVFGFIYVQSITVL